MKELLVLFACVAFGSVICICVPIVKSVHEMHVESQNSDEFARKTTLAQQSLTTIELKSSETILQDSILSWK